MSLHTRPQIRVRVLSLCFTLLLELACGGGGSSGGNSGSSGGGNSGGIQPPPPTVTSVSVSGPATVQTNACVNYVATVTGTGNFDPRVQWSINGVDGGNPSLGLIDTNGRYCAPPKPLQDPPTFIPVTIRAVSVVNFMTDSVSAQILYPPPVITSISPQPATAGDQITITGQYIFPLLNVVFSDAAGGGIAAPGTASDGTSITVNVPQGSVTGAVWLATPSDYLYPTRSNNLQFQRLARLRIRAPQNDVAAGESVTFQYAFLGDATQRAVTFSADQGSFSGATYLAPSVVPSDTFDHITGCIDGTHVCDTQLIGLHPFRIAPAVPIVPLSESLQLSAIVGNGQVGATWNLLAGGGSLNPTGLYQAGTQTQDGGPALISALSSGATEQASVGVTGAFPGLVNRIYDYVDQHTQDAVGTYVRGAAAVGNRLYVACTNHSGAYSDSYFWIDVYDLTDPARPLWITAVEANSDGPVYAMGEYLYSYSRTDLAVPSYPSTITLYSVAGGVPVLKARTQVPYWWSIQAHGGVLTEIAREDVSTRASAKVLLYDLTGGTIADEELHVPLPPDANYYLPDAALSTSNRIFLSIQKNDNMGAYILTYDSSHLNLLGSVSGRGLFLSSSGNLLFGANGGMDIYDISSQLPQWEAHVNYVSALNANGSQLLVRTAHEGCRVLDISNPQDPRVASVLFDGVLGACTDGFSAGGYVYVPENGGGLALYDASQSGGPVLKASLYAGDVFSAATYDMVFQGQYLYTADATDLGGSLSIYDTTTQPPIRVGQYSDNLQEAYALQPLGDYLYLGLSNNFGIIDITQPNSPALVGSFPLQVVSFANAGTTVYAATVSNNLVVLDASNPLQPNVVRTLPLIAFPIKLRVSGSLLLAADGSGGLVIYDITAPTNPILLAQVTSFIAVNDVAVQGTTAFVAADTDGLGVLDISNPSNPIVLSKTSLSSDTPFERISSPTQALSVTSNNGFTYIGANNDGLIFGFDCASLSTPRLISIYDLPSSDWVAVMLFQASDMFAGGNLGISIGFGQQLPVMQLDMSAPFDSINQFFPPLALQNFGPSLPVRGRRADIRFRVRSQGRASPVFFHSGAR